ncbi:MAG: hypothetical protein GC192_16320 [Bacteroidetes bacterium]|nr:hypothetical protein [Bacteroidota bacterium]
MPSFPQYALESLLAFWLLLGYYRLTHFHVNSFLAKRWQLRLMPVFAGLLPLLQAAFLNVSKAVPFEKQAMSFTQLMDYRLPEYTITIGSLMLAFYFVGVLVSSFRLMDRLWLILQFLEKNGNHAARLVAWQTMPTAAMSNLILNWQYFDEEKKAEWLKKWMPTHPIYAWEAVFMEILVVLNWWNPLVYRYRRYWAELYDNWQNSAQERTGLVPTSIGYMGLAVSLGLIFMWVPVAFSPTQKLFEVADDLVKTTIFENKIDKPHDYYVDWGGLKMPLSKFANPNGYSASMKLYLADFQDVINKPFVVYKDGQPMKPGILSILYKNKQHGTQAYINGIDPHKIVLLDRQKGLVFNDSLGLGDELTLFGDTEDIYLSKIEIKIKDPNAGYEPPFFVPQINQLEATMPYQIVVRKGQRTLVKIDPDNPNTDRIVQLYGDARQYEIVRIPGFRTNRHYLTEAESLASKVAAANTTLTYMEEDAYYLPEYQSYQGKDVRMIWGDMSASPSNLNYSLDSFLVSIKNEPQLMVGDDTLNIVSFQVIVAGKNLPSRSFFTYRTGDQAVHDALQDVQDETSVFFEKIVVYDEQHQRKLFPASFAFNVGNPAKQHILSYSDKNYMLLFGEKTEVIKTPDFNHVAADSMVKSFKEKIRKK